MSTVGFTVGMRNERTFTTGDTILYDLTLYNDGGHFNPNSGIFTVPSTGVYQFTITAKPKNNTGKAEVELQKNGGIVARAVGWDIPNGRGSASGTNAVTISCNEGETISVKVVSDATLDSSPGLYNSFSGVQLSKL